MNASISSPSESNTIGPARRKQTQSPFLLNPNLAAICIAVAALIALGGSYGFRLLRAASVLHHDNTQPLILRTYEHFFGSRFNVSDTAFPGTSGPIQMRVYTPVGVNNPAPIVLVHGFATDGSRNNYLNSIASRLAGVGFKVVMPTVPGESHDQMLSSDLAVIDDTIRWTAHNTGQQVSVLGVSFGGGLVVPAAAQPSVAGDVKLIISFSGYNDLESIARYYMHERVNDPYGNPYPGHPLGPLLITSLYLKELVPLRDVPALLSVVDRVDQNGGHALPPNDPTILALNADQRREFDELQRVDTPKVRQLYADSLARHGAEMAAISPSSVVKTLKIPLFVLHGTDDPAFPEAEIEWMRQEAAGNPNVRILVTPWVSHVFLGQPATKWQKIRVIIFCAEMFSRAASKSQAVH